MEVISIDDNYKNDEEDKALNPAFFILGAQRSGTTLLRLMLNNHSEVAIPTESSQFMPFLNKKLLDSGHLSLSRKKTIIQYLMKNSQFAKWNMDMAVLEKTLEKELTLKQFISYLYTSFATRYGKRICGDKSLTFIRKMKILEKAYPDAKVIHIVRDGRDTLMSLRKLHAPEKLNACLKAFEWKIKILLIQGSLNCLKDRNIEIRYEDLLRNPHKELRKVCEFLELPFEEQMLEFWKKSPEYIAKHHSDLIFKPIDASNIFKWKKQLSNLEARKYSYIARKILKQYNYEIPSETITFKEKIMWWSELIIHLPKRLLSSIRVAIVMRIASKFGLRVGPAFYDTIPGKNNKGIYF